MLWYDFTSQFLHRSPEHIPLFWESYYEFEESLCWNCGGECTLERRTPGGWMETTPCWTCNAIGVLMTSVEAVDFQEDWMLFPQEFPIFFLNGDHNIWTL